MSRRGFSIRLLTGIRAAHVIITHVITTHVIVALLWVCFATPAWPLDIPTRLELAMLAAVAPDGTITLSDGRFLRLVDLEAPQTEAAMAAWQAAVARLSGQSVTLEVQGPGTDRYGRVQALVNKPDHMSLQSELVTSGFARVMPSLRMGVATSGLLKDEAKARRARRGIWHDPAFAVIEADQIARLGALAGRYVLVEGEILDAVSRKGRLYLNFGSDWRTDFTVTVAPADARLGIGRRVGDQLVLLPDLIGRRVRVRGFITRYNGPEVIVTNSSQLEFLGSAATANED